MLFKELFLISSQVRQQFITYYFTFQRKLSNKQVLCYCAPFFFNYRENNVFTRDHTKVNLQLELYVGKRLCC